MAQILICCDEALTVLWRPLPRNIQAVLTSAALATIATLYLMRAHLGHLAQRLMGQHGDVLYSYLTLTNGWDALLRGAPLQTLNVHFAWPVPHALALGDNLFALMLFGLPIAAVGEPVLAYNLLLLGSFVACAAAGTLFLFALTQSRLASITAGLLWAFMPLKLDHLEHLNNLWMAGAALLAWAVVRWIETPSWKYVLWAAMAMVLQFGMSIQLAVHTALLSGVFGLVLWRGRSQSVSTQKRLLHLAGFAALTLGLLSPWIWAFVQTRAYAPAQRPTDEMLSYAIQAKDYVGHLSPGWALWMLAALGLVFKHRARWALLITVGVALVMGLGPYILHNDVAYRLPYAALMELLPPYQSIRVPHRIERVGYLFLSGLAGLALFHVRVRWPRFVWVLTGAMALVAWLQLPVVSPRTQELPQFAVADFLRTLPSDTVVAPVPLVLNWFERPPLDVLAQQARTTFLGGYTSLIPEAFWRLRYVTDTAPWPTREGLFARAGATHMLVDKHALGPDEQQTLPVGVYNDARHRVIALAVPPVVEQTHQLRGPSQVPAGELVTFELQPSTDTFVPTTQATVSVRLVRAAQPAVDLQAKAWSSWVMGLLLPGFRLQIEAPRVPGLYSLEALGSAVSFDVKDTLAWVPDGQRFGAEAVQVQSPPETVGRGRYVGLHVKLTNTSPYYWPALSFTNVPARAGQIAHGSCVGRERRAYSGRAGHITLPHDLAPGDTAEATLYIEAPKQAGTYALGFALGSEPFQRGGCGASVATLKVWP